jgi:uncharacterized delta-60 repeat protein
MAIQPDGRILAGGWSYTVNGVHRGFALARYDPHGSLDPTFGTGGKVLTDGGYLLALRLQEDGTILAAGVGPDGLRLVRYLPNGSLDPSFGQGGVVDTPAPEPFRFGSEGMIFAPDGSIFAPGYSYVDLPNENCSCPALAVTHFNSDGTLDHSFGGDGQVVAFASGSSYAYGLAVQEDGRLVAAGVLYTPHHGVFAVVRYNPDGSRDQTFGHHGKARTRFGRGNSIAFSVSLDAEDQAVATGFALGDLALARYTA